jgi:hypothetical protein
MEKRGRGGTYEGACNRTQKGLEDRLGEKI